MVRHLNVYLAQIWVLDESDKMLHLKASSGAVSDFRDSNDHSHRSGCRAERRTRRACLPPGRNSRSRVTDVTGSGRLGSNTDLGSCPRHSSAKVFATHSSLNGKRTK